MLVRCLLTVLCLAAARRDPPHRKYLVVTAPETLATYKERPDLAITLEAGHKLIFMKALEVAAGIAER